MGQSPTWGRPAPQGRLERQFWVVQMPRAATSPPGEWICVSLHSTCTVGLGCFNMRAYNFFVCGPKFTDFPEVKLRMSCSWNLLFRFSTRGSVPEIFAIKVWSCMKLGQILHVLGPQFIWRRTPSFWTCITKCTQIAIMWQSFTAIGRGSSEISWRKKWKKTSAVKYRTQGLSELPFRAA